MSDKSKVLKQAKFVPPLAQKKVPMEVVFRNEMDKIKKQFEEINKRLAEISAEQKSLRSGLNQVMDFLEKDEEESTSDIDLTCDEEFY